MKEDGCKCLVGRGSVSKRSIMPVEFRPAESVNEQIFQVS